MSFVLIFCFFSIFPSKAEKTLILSPGERFFLDRPANQTLRIGDKSLIAAEPIAGKLSLLARKKGQTRLISGARSYRLYILDQDLKTKAVHLEGLFKEFKGLSWSLSPDQKFEIKGELHRFADWLSIKQAFEKFRFEYEFKARMDEELKKISSYYLKQQIKKPFEILWEELPFIAVPEGSPLSGYQKALSAFGLKAREGKSWFFKAPLLEIEFAVVESLSSSSFFSGGGLNKNLSGFSSLLSFLNFLKSSGKGKSLHHSSLLAQDGKKTELELGGGIPVRSFHLESKQESVHWKSHGLKLSLKPQLDRKRQIFLQIQASLSEPLAGSFAGGAPPLKSQTLETEMVLSSGQIFKLFGLKKRSRGWGLQGGLNFFLKDLNFLNGSQSSHQTAHHAFLQIKILEPDSSDPKLPVESMDLKLKKLTP